MKNNWEILKYVLLLFIGWRAALLFVTLLGLSNFANNDSIQHLYFPPHSGLDYWSRWANWDGGHYMGIAVNGYLPIQTVFFPAYPVFIKLLTLLGIHFFWAGFLISQISTVVALFYLYKIVLLDFRDEIAKKALFALLIFPTSFYLVSVYSESLFLASALAAFYYTRTKKWFLASLIGGIAAATRLVGVAVILGVFAEYLLKDTGQFNLKLLWQTRLRRLLMYTIGLVIFLGWIETFFVVSQNWLATGITGSILQFGNLAILTAATLTLFEFIAKHIQWRKILSLDFVSLLITVLPLTSYLIYLKLQFGNPLSFLSHEASWGKALSVPWQGALNYYSILSSRNFLQIGDTNRMLFQLVVFIILVGGLIFSLYKFRTSYTIFYSLAFVIPLLSGTLMDLPRYALAIFPIFLVFALIKNELIQRIGVVISLLMLSALSMLYINSYWFL